MQEDDAHHDEEIGEAFQDEDNMAAILMRKHVETGDLMMVSLLLKSHIIHFPSFTHTKNLSLFQNDCSLPQPPIDNVI